MLLAQSTYISKLPCSIILRQLVVAKTFQHSTQYVSYRVQLVQNIVDSAFTESKIFDSCVIACTPKYEQKSELESYEVKMAGFCSSTPICHSKQAI